MLDLRNILILLCIVHMISCEKYKWSPEEKEKIINDCPRPEKELCECGVDIISRNISFENYEKAIELLKSYRIKTFDLKKHKQIIDKVLDIEQMIEYQCGKVAN